MVFITMWTCVAVLVLWTTLRGCSIQASTSNLVQFTAADFHEKLHMGKMMFLYFEQQVPPDIALFLVQLEKSAEALQDYGVLVGKVNCDTEKVRTYCTDERLQHTVFLFRGGKEFLGFDLDTVFDVHSIVSEVLFAILREEVRYVHTDADLLAMEKTARGKKDIVLVYVRSLGTQEHRSMMETAYVYGSKYQFILITGGPVLKHFNVSESSVSSQAWFLHCRGHSSLVTSERCPLTPMTAPLSTLSLHSFLQLMEAPLVSEVYDDPSSVPPPQFPYQLTPQVFIFSRPETEHLDRDTATALAWRLRGLALLLLVHRHSPAVKTPEEYNAAYRLPEKSAEVKYFTLHSLDEVLDLFTSQENDEDEEEYEEEDEEDLEKLDDEIAASVFENGGETPDSDSVAHLTSHSFHTSVAQSRLTVALFYLKWDAASVHFLSSFIDVAETLAAWNVDDVQMSCVDCGEWSDLCAAQPGRTVPFPPITVFPTVLLFRPHQLARRYRGMLGSGALQRFILMSREPSPSLLSTEEEVALFLREAPRPGLTRHEVDKVVGLFKTRTQTGLSAFAEAAESLRGEALSGLVTDAPAEKWAAEHSIDLPAVLVFPSWDTHMSPLRLTPPPSADELLAHINSALLNPMPELTVENLPTFLSLGKALLLLFVGEDEDEIGRRQNQALVEEMRGVVGLGGERMERYLPCWIHLGHTPAGMSILGSYLGSMPPLPALVLTHLPSGDEIYQYPPKKVIEASSVLRWVQQVEDGTEPPAGMLGNDSWPPTGHFYDFLQIMDAEEGSEEEEEEEEEDVDVREHLSTKEAANYNPKKTPEPHSEL